MSDTAIAEAELVELNSQIEADSVYALAKTTGNLPEDPAELWKFNIFGPQGLKDYKAGITRLDRSLRSGKLNQDKLAELKELRTRMLRASIDLANLTFQSQATLGRFFDALERGPAGRPKKDETPGVSPYQLALSQLGSSKQEAGRLREIAQHPDLMKKVLQEAEKKQVVPSVNQLLTKIKAQEGPPKPRKNRTDLGKLTRGWSADLTNIARLFTGLVKNDQWQKVPADARVEFVQAMSKIDKAGVEYWGADSTGWLTSEKAILATEQPEAEE